MDPKKQTKYLDQNKEIAEQFDYSHSQANEDDRAPKHLKQADKPIDAHLRHPKYWLTIIIVVACYAAVASYLSTLLTYAIYVVMIVLTFRTISKLKKHGIDELTQFDKYKMVFFMAFEPIIGQALYYYRLRKTMPKAAGIALSIGWKVFGLILIGLAIYIFSTVIQSWEYRYGNTFQVNLDKVTSDLNAITADAKEYDSVSLIENCNKLETDVAAIKKSPPFPNESVQAQLSNALATLDKGAKNCAKAVRFEDPPLLQQSNTELNKGLEDLKTTVGLMKS